MCILDIANVCNNYFVELCNYVKSKPKLFKQKKDQCIDILYIYIYMLLTVVQLEHQFIPFKL